MTLKSKKLLFYTALVLLSLISISWAFYQAQLFSFDLHLSPTKMVLNGENHYEYILNGKRDFSESDKILYDQNGVYGHGLFIILMPLTFLSWSSAKILWAMLNILFILLILFLFFKKFKTNLNNKFLIIAIVLCSTPLRINIGYGQQTLLPLLFFFIPFLYQNKIGYILSGISYIKYNIGYGLFLYLFSKFKLRNILLSCLFPIFFWLLYSLFTNTNIFISLTQPIEALAYYQKNFQNHPVTIFSLLKNFNINSYIIFIVSIITNFIVINFCKNCKDDLYKVSIISLSILSFSSHQLHDYILLLPLLIYSINNFQLKISKINIILIFYFFFFLRILSSIYGFMPWDFPYGLFGYINNAILLIFLSINLIYLSKVNK